MSMLGAGAGSAPVFDLNDENSHPAGLAFTSRGKGSIYVGNAEPGSVNPNERVYRYSTGGVLLNEYRPVNPLPVSGDRTVRGKIVSMTECGGYLAIVWNRAQAHPTESNRRLNEAAITWMPLDAVGQAQSIGVRTSYLWSNSVPAGGTATGPCVAPYQGARGTAGGSRWPFFVLIRGAHPWLYSMNYTLAGVRNNDPPANVAGIGGNPPTGTGRTSRARLAGRSDPAANIRGTGSYEILGLAAGAVPVSMRCVLTGQAGIWHLLITGTGLTSHVSSASTDRGLTDEFTAAMATSTRGMAGDPLTRRVFTVHSDGVVRTNVL